MSILLKGFVDTDCGLEPFVITDQGAVFVNENLRDDLETVAEFVEEVGGTYYPSKKDYKHDRGLPFPADIVTLSQD